MGTKLDTAEMRRRRREYIIIAVSLVLVVAVTVIELKLSRLSRELPIGNNILFFALLNVDLMLVLLLIFLVVRNLTKLFIERRKGIFGSKLKTRLVMAFMGLSLLPTAILFFVALKFMNFNFEGWFDPQVEKIFSTSNEIVQGKYKSDAEEMLRFAKQIGAYVQENNLLNIENAAALEEYVKSKRKEYGLLDARIVWDSDRTPVVATRGGTKFEEKDLKPSDNFVARAYKGEEGYMVDPGRGTDVIRAIVPLHSGGPDGPIESAMITQMSIDKSLFQEMQENKRGYLSYMELRRMKTPLKTTHFVFLAVTSLLALFTASWFGFHIAKTLTVPLEKLAAATEEVAEGQLDVTLDADGQDEMSTLARSFNRMMRQIEVGRTELEKAYGTLERKNIELDRRRRYMETILANVAAGVISTDSEGRITNINKSAEKLFRIDLINVLGKPAPDILNADQKKLLRDLMDELADSREGSIRRVLMLPMSGTPVHFQITLTELRNDEKELVGTVAIFEDLTQIMQAQKAIAWKDVARRIAHEIKNPLTPIQLYAERLRKRYSGKFEPEDNRVFVECVDSIIDQVSELRDMVDEFRKFARLPTAKPAPADLNEVVRETTILYRESGGPVKFTMSLDASMPIFDLDREQMKRALNNIFDNAIAAIAGPGEIAVSTSFIEPMQIARIEVADTGPGIPFKDRRRIFEPDFSTKKGGSGLGLAIVERIVSDHFGFIRVRNNHPHGTVFVIELPTYRPLLGTDVPRRGEETDNANVEKI